MDNLEEINIWEMVHFRAQELPTILVELVDQEDDELLQFSLRELDRAQAKIREKVIKEKKSVRRMKIVGSIVIGIILIIIAVIFFTIFE